LISRGVCHRAPSIVPARARDPRRQSARINADAERFCVRLEVRDAAWPSGAGPTQCVAGCSHRFLFLQDVLGEQGDDFWRGDVFPSGSPLMLQCRRGGAPPHARGDLVGYPAVAGAASRTAARFFAGEETVAGFLKAQWTDLIADCRGCFFRATGFRRNRGAATMAGAESEPHSHSGHRFD